MNAIHTIAVMRAGLPQVTLAQRVVDKMVRGALTYGTETGEALIGLSLAVANHREPDFYVLDTIAPDASAVRMTAYFEQGDDLQSDILNWLADNWNDGRKRANSTLEPRWNVPLIHLGDWHKHPGTMTEPSWGDTHTAFDLITDPEIGRPYLLAILATVWDRTAAHKLAPPLLPSEQPLIVDISDDETLSIRLDCWYISRYIRRFIHLAPVVQPDAQLPQLPIVGWHLHDAQRLRREVEGLQAAGYDVLVNEGDTDGIPPREVCLTLLRPEGERALIVVTPADFPRQPPSLRLVAPEAFKPLADANRQTFADLWARSEPLTIDFVWGIDSTLAEFAQKAEEQLKAKLKVK